MRKATIARKTNETEISVSVNLDGTGTAYAPGSPVFEHMRADDAARSHLTRRWRSA